MPVELLEGTGQWAAVPDAGPEVSAPLLVYSGTRTGRAIVNAC